jgi:hypothetical protein
MIGVVWYVKDIEIKLKGKGIRGRKRLLSENLKKDENPCNVFKFDLTLH